MSEKQTIIQTGISAFTLHMIAMILMLMDHLWATIISGNDWLTWFGRLAFPIFAFMIAEGYHYTHNLKRYVLRLLIFAVISEIPFNYLMGSSWFYPYHQNVIWTFLLGIGCIWLLEKVRSKGKLWLTVLLGVIIAFVGFILGFVLMLDYFGVGVLSVLLFHVFRGNKWWQRLGQLTGLFVLNWYLMGSMYVPITIAGHTFEVVQQGVAVFALIPIWLYKGKQGPHNRFIQYGFYAFYPIHITVLVVLWSMIV